MQTHKEPIIWTVALLVLFFMSPSANAFSFCLFKLAGFASCPGCGLGHAIHEALHLRFKESLHQHLLGIPATIGILHQIFSAFIKPKQNLQWINNKC